MKENFFLSINCRGQLLTFSRTMIMGILNITPDSFFDGGRFFAIDDALIQADKMIKEGVDIIDIGGYSSRPGADDVAEEEEMGRVLPVIEALSKEYPDVIMSIDTFRSSVASAAIEAGAHIVNDISASMLDPKMMELVASYKDVPYIMMHMQGKPQNMQVNPQYDHIVNEIWSYFIERIEKAKSAGIRDLVIDPGFGFGKSLLHNYQLLKGIETFKLLEMPLLTGISRKSMIYRLLDSKPEEVLAPTAVLHAKLISSGANILRVHDVKEARQVVNLMEYLAENGII